MILAKTMADLPIAWKMNSNKLYFNHYTFIMSYKLFSYLTSLSCSKPVNLSTLTFGNTSLAEAMQNLPISWTFNQK